MQMSRLSGASCIYVGSQVSVRKRPCSLEDMHAACPFGSAADAVALLGIRDAVHGEYGSWQR
jgi:hypothetical protein